MQPISLKNKLFMSETRLVHFNDENVVKFSNNIKYKNPNCTVLTFFGQVFGESLQFISLAFIFLEFKV